MKCALFCNKIKRNQSFIQIINAIIKQVIAKIADISVIFPSLLPLELELLKLLKLLENDENDVNDDKE